MIITKSKRKSTLSTKKAHFINKKSSMVIKKITKKI